MAVAAIPAMGQDLMARQAPVDRKMKAVDTFQLRRLIMREQLESPMADLYEGWDKTYAHKATELPDSFRINLKDFCMPTVSRVVTSNFGPRWGRMHKGLDIKVYTGDTIRAAFSGKVRMVRYEASGYGKYIVIRHGNGLETIYGHLSKQLVKEDQEVKAGDVIGLGGNTGRSTGSHLHFETRLCGVALNPAIMFDFKNQDVVDDTYMFRKKTYEREGLAATRLRGKNDDAGYTREQVQGAGAGVSSPRAAEEAPATSKREKKAMAKAAQYYKVKKGDTLYSIAKKHGMTLKELCNLNHLGTKAKLRAGQIIRFS